MQLVGVDLSLKTCSLFTRERGGMEREMMMMMMMMMKCYTSVIWYQHWRPPWSMQIKMQHAVVSYAVAVAVWHGSLVSRQNDQPHESTVPMMEEADGSMDGWDLERYSHVFSHMVGDRWRWKLEIERPR